MNKTLKASLMKLREEKTQDILRKGRVKILMGHKIIEEMHTNFAS